MNLRALEEVFEERLEAAVRRRLGDSGASGTRGFLSCAGKARGPARDGPSKSAATGRCAMTCHVSKRSTALQPATRAQH